MQVQVNSEKIEIEEGLTIDKFFFSYANKEARGVALAVNDSVVSRKDWAQTVLHENDRILIITATQGG
ncbi:MAG: sulfur carrier protein ThiS [Bdellovibrionales bacterium]|nr:sulfur carrier protein ThiS [Bdellovibrionales bacterium]